MSSADAAPKSNSKTKTLPGAGLLRLRLNSIGDLQNCYMPFVRGGGLFLRDEDAYAPGDRVFLLIRLPQEDRPEAVAAQVSWITPANEQTGLLKGTGFRFCDNNSRLREQIESLLSQESREEVRGHTL